MADLTETFVAGAAPHEQKTGKGMKMLAYTATKVAQNDTVTLGDLTTVVDAYARDVSTGAHDPVAVSGNVITLKGATTGAVKIIAWGY